MNTRYGSLRCAAIGADMDVKPDEVQLIRSVSRGATIAQFKTAIRINSRVTLFQRPNITHF